MATEKDVLVNTFYDKLIIRLANIKDSNYSLMLKRWSEKLSWRGL
ncbi:hypothetical protein B6N60_03056 [Richelia sinica FACHB-800]|uniref:Uncharacterized protein n=1 Tax=Richelia sinica FACHB-800 TaxID=1357546 RepID=A0A975T8T4_9NOST|nr:hypothetical protein B6N60_03056 [Richelia sinica FACHB-800]